jgi:hypothetical protein
MCDANEMLTLEKVCNMLFASFLTVSAHFGLGKHIFDLDPYHAKTAMHWDFLAQNWGVMTVSYIVAPTVWTK